MPRGLWSRRASLGLFLPFRSGQSWAPVSLPGPPSTPAPWCRGWTWTRGVSPPSGEVRAGAVGLGSGPVGLVLSLLPRARGLGRAEVRARSAGCFCSELPASGLLQRAPRLGASPVRISQGAWRKDAPTPEGHCHLSRRVLILPSGLKAQVDLVAAQFLRRIRVSRAAPLLPLSCFVTRERALFRPRSPFGALPVRLPVWMSQRCSEPERPIRAARGGEWGAALGIAPRSLGRPPCRVCPPSSWKAERAKPPAGSAGPRAGPS